jgi:hypothetical protein
MNKPLLPALFLLALTSLADAQVANIKVVTDANPDYSDMESMTRSITLNHKTDAEKMWALFHWNHIGRRPSATVQRHGLEITDPIRHFNDYGYTNFTAISGLNTSIWSYMGYPCRLTGLFSEVWYDGTYHLYDNAFGMIYSLPDGKTIASSADLAKTMAGPETGGKPVRGYLALYHALTGTGPNSFIQGGSGEKPISDLIDNFGTDSQPVLRHQRGHRFILNLRPGETYTRHYTRHDATSSKAIVLDHEISEYKADPAAFVHQGLTGDELPGDPELGAPSFFMRGTGERTFNPILDAKNLGAATFSTSNIQPIPNATGLQPQTAGQPATAIFKVEGSNIIASIKLRALATLATPQDSATIAISTDNGVSWKEIWAAKKNGDNAADFQILKEINGHYDCLFKVTLTAKNKPEDAQLKFIGFNAWTQINSKTQPKLNLGANTIYVGTGDPSNSIVIEPELQKGLYKPHLFEEKNIKVNEEHWGSHPVLSVEERQQNAHIVFKVDSPTDITSVTYGGRFHINAPKNHVDLLHSFDNGKTWRQSASVDPAKDNVSKSTDLIHYETVADVPPSTRSVLFKYGLNDAAPDNRYNTCAIYALRMEVNHKLADPTPVPMEVTFHWREIQRDRKLVSRSHTQLVEKFPSTYQINVGGADHPIIDTLVVSLKGTRSDPHYGYLGGPDPALENPEAAKKWIGNWQIVGKNIALGKPYTLSVPSSDNWGAGDPNRKKLTNGIVGHAFAGGNAYSHGALWLSNQLPEITLDLGSVQKCAAFRVHVTGYPGWDVIKGEVEDIIEVLTSNDGKNFQPAGTFNFLLFKKDIPLNFMMPETETLAGYNFALPLQTPIEARYIKYKITPKRPIVVTEVQVLDSYKLEPFDLNIALPDLATNGKIATKPDLSPNAKKWQPTELPKQTP